MYIALDIGGTQIRIAASKTSDNPSLDSVAKFSITNIYEKDLETIFSAIDTLRNGEAILGIGCGFPGVFSEDNKTIIKAPNLSGWVGKAFVSDLVKVFGCPVWIENDETICALGEAAFGYGKNKDFVYVTWGTGFGGAVVTHEEGHLTVRQFEAGHHIIVWENGKVCGCGQTGCVEAYIGGGNIEKYYQKKPQDLPPEEWEEVYEYLANGLVNIIAFNPTRLIMLGGGIALHQKENLEKIKTKIQERLHIYPMPELQVTSLGDNVGLYGAFSLIKK